MKRVFADAFFYIAAFNRTDAAHEKAQAWAADARAQVVTTTAVLLEVADAMSAPAWRTACARFIEKLITQSRTIVRQVDDDLFQRGLQLYRSRADKEWSLTDCISFTVMADEGLTDALTGDHHFEQAGFAALLA